MRWEVLKSSFEIQSFHGLAGYYQRFIREFSKIAVPITRLTRKDVTFHCRTEQQPSFKTLWQKIYEETMLTLPKGVDDFVVYCNASIMCLGVVLMHRGCIIAYASSQLKPYKVKYLAHDMKLGWVVFTLKIWHRYLWTLVYYLHRPQKSEVSYGSAQFEYEARKMA